MQSTFIVSMRKFAGEMEFEKRYYFVKHMNDICAFAKSY